MVKRDAEKTRRSILHAAEAVFADKGFAGASLSDIANGASVTKSLIHHHFGSKEEVWRQVKASRFSEFARQQLNNMAEQDSFEDFVRQGARSYFSFLRDNPNVIRLFWWSQAEQGFSLHPERDRMMHQAAQLLLQQGVAHIRRFQKRGDIRLDVDAALVYASFVGLMRHWFVARRDYGLGEDEASAERYLETVIMLFLEGIRTRDS